MWRSPNRLLGRRQAGLCSQRSATPNQNKEIFTMFKFKFLAVAFLLSVMTMLSSAQTISTVAGGGSIHLDSGGLSTNAYLNSPMAVAVDSSGNVYFADYGSTGGAVVYKITSGLWISIVAGTGAQGYTGDGGAATSATFGPWIGGIAVAPSGNIYISDVYYSVIRKVTVSTGIISTYAGKNKTLYGGGYCGDGGAATSACLYSPTGLYVTSSSLYIADNGNHRVRYVNSNGIISTVAGNGTQAFAGDNGPATSAELTNPWALALDSTGNLYIGDTGLNGANCRIRKVLVSTGIISTYSGNSYCGAEGNGVPVGSAQLGLVKGLAFDSNGNLYIADSTGNIIREVMLSTQIISTVAGTGNEGFSGDGGPPKAAEFNSPQGVAVYESTYYIADTDNQRIRMVH